MYKTIKGFSLLVLTLNQIIVIYGNYEALLSPKRFFILETGQSISIKFGNKRYQVEPHIGCQPRPLFGFQFSKRMSDLPLCPPVNIPPLIDRTFKNVSVNAGQPIKFDLTYTGFPKPLIIFFKSGQQLVSNNRIIATDSLVIEKSTLEDSAIYTMVAKNALGMDWLNFTVEVKPLSMSTFTPSPMIGCPPKVDKFGQSVVTLNDSIQFEWNEVNLVNVRYKVQLYVNQSESWRTIAQVPENLIIVRNMKCYLSYTFRVIVNANGCDSPPREAPPVSVGVGVPKPIPNPITVVELLPERITIEWNPSTDECGSPVFEYSIEKQYFNSSDWHKIGKSAVISRQFTDTYIKGVFRYAIKAVNGFGESAPFITTYIKPNKKCPKMAFGVVSPYDITRESLHLQWYHWIHEKDMIYTFQVERSDSESEIWNPLGNTSDYTFFVNQLKCRTEYRFRVKVFTPECEAVVLDSLPIKTFGIPEPPVRPISVNILEGGRMHMSWTLSPDVCDIPVEGYTVEKQYNNSVDWKFMGRISVNEFLDPNIEQTYRFRIRSVNKFGESAPLITRFVTPMDMLSKIKCPQRQEGTTEVTILSRDSVALKWENSISDKNIKYKFQLQKLETGSDVWESFGSTYDYQTVVNNLNYKTEYKFRVKVLAPNCEAGILESKPIMTSYAPGSPTRPISLAIMDQGRLKISWTVPPEGSVNQYIIEKQYNTSETWSIVGRTNENSFPDNNIGNTYRFRIRSVNMYGESAPLTTKFFTPIDMIPKICLKRPEVMVDVLNITRISLFLNWKQSIPDEKANYTFQIDKQEPGSEWQTLGQTSRFDTFVNDLKCYTDYQFRVRVLSPDCQSVPLESRPIKTSGAPDPPLGPISVNVLDLQRLSLNWTSPPIACGAPLIGFNIERQYNGSEEWRSVAISQGNEIQDNEIAGTYRYRIRAANKYGESLPLMSDIMTPHLMLPKEKCPEKKDSLLGVEAVSRNSFKLGWDDLITQKSSKSVAQVELWEASAGNWTHNKNTTDYSILLNPLKCNTEYKFRVKVLTPECADIILESKAIPISGLPEPPPKGIMANIQSYNLLIIEWKAPPLVCDAPILEYIVERKYDNSENWTFVTKTAENTTKETKIEESFRYRIRAINKFGESEPLISKSINPYEILKKTIAKSG